VSIFWRCWLIVNVLIAVVLTILVLLSTIQFEATLSNFIHGRMSVLAQTTQASLKTAMHLGLPLSSVRNAKAIFERARQIDPNISTIYVFDHSGKILHSTDPNPPTSVRAEVLFAQSESTSTQWRTETNLHILSGASILGAAGELAGGVVIVNPKTALETSVRAMSARLALYFIATFVFVAAISVIVLRFGLENIAKIFSGIEAAFSAIEKREWRQLAGGSNPAPAPVSGFGVNTGELEELLNRAEDKYVSIGRELASLESEGNNGGKSRESKPR